MARISVVWRDNGFNIIDLESPKILITVDENLDILPKLSVYEAMQIALLNELVSGIERRAKYIHEPESEIEFKKRMGWY